MASVKPKLTSRQRALGPACQFYRQRLGVSQLEVARRLGYTSAQIISNFERGICGLPTKKLIGYAKICEIPESIVVGISLSESLYQMLNDCSEEVECEPSIFFRSY